MIKVVDDVTKRTDRPISIERCTLGKPQKTMSFIVYLFTAIKPFAVKFDCGQSAVHNDT